MAGDSFKCFLFGYCNMLGVICPWLSACVGMGLCAALFPCEMVVLVLRLWVVCVWFGCARLLTFVRDMDRSGGYLGLLGRDSGCSGGIRGELGELGVT